MVDTPVASRLYSAPFSASLEGGVKLRSLQERDKFMFGPMALNSHG